MDVEAAVPRAEDATPSAALLVSYSQRPHFDTSLWHAKPISVDRELFLYELIVDTYLKILDVLPPECRPVDEGGRGPPNCCVATNYMSSESETADIKGDEHIRFHSDMYDAEGKRVSQRAGTPVISVSFGATMHFEIKHRGKKEGKLLTTLEDSSILVWTAEDDEKLEHRPFWPANRRPRSSRWALVLRWVDTCRMHELSEPFRCVSGKGEVWMLPEALLPLKKK